MQQNPVQFDINDVQSENARNDLRARITRFNNTAIYSAISGRARHKNPDLAAQSGHGTGRSLHSLLNEFGFLSLQDYSNRSHDAHGEIRTEPVFLGPIYPQLTQHLCVGMVTENKLRRPISSGLPPVSTDSSIISFAVLARHYGPNGLFVANREMRAQEVSVVLPRSAPAPSSTTGWAN